MRPRRVLPAGIRGRGSVFTWTWRDGAGRQYSRRAGKTLAEAEAFKWRIDARPERSYGSAGHGGDNHSRS